LLKGERSARYSPIEVAQWIEDLAAGTAGNLAKAQAQSAGKDRPEFRGQRRVGQTRQPGQGRVRSRYHRRREPGTARPLAGPAARHGQRHRRGGRQTGAGQARRHASASASRWRSNCPSRSSSPPCACTTDT
jgi:hypothetical protein